MRDREDIVSDLDQAITDYHAALEARDTERVRRQFTDNDFWLESLEEHVDEAAYRMASYADELIGTLGGKSK